MNHGKTNPPISFCPNCGQKFSSGSKASRRCDKEVHQARRKDRALFCYDCGDKLSESC